MSQDIGKKPVTGRCEDVNKLAPFVQERLKKALDELHAGGVSVAPFETYRSPERQLELYSQGRDTPGRKVTNAKPWQSFHQYGLAVDLVFKDGKKWSWDGDYSKVTDVMKKHGFESLDFEKVHFEITGHMNYREAYDMMKKVGLEGLWALIEKRINLKL